MLTSPSLRTLAALTAGGGSTIADCGDRTARRVSAAIASGVGATTSIESDAVARTLPGSTSGGGATIEFESDAVLRRAVWPMSGAGTTICDGSVGVGNGLRSVAAVGTGRFALLHATMFGVATSCVNLMLGGVTIV